jgi:protein-tyrosine phosphatase
MSLASYQTALPRATMVSRLGGCGRCQPGSEQKNRDMPSILMVCLGNICRSPMAEAVLRAQVAGRGDAATWVIDSAGTGDWHVGDPPDPRTVAVLAEQGIVTAHRGRQVRAADFREFDVILVMDDANLAAIAAFRPAQGATARLARLGDWDPRGRAEVPDPYYSTGLEAFREVHAQVERCCRSFVTEWDRTRAESV